MTMPHPEAQTSLADLSIKERLSLIDTLNHLPISQLLTIEIALGIPPEVMPSFDAPQGYRTATLMQWLEGPSGLGLKPLLDALSEMGIEETKHLASDSNNVYTTGLRIKLEGDFDELDRENLKQLLLKIQEMAQDFSIEMNRVRRGSIEIELQGSATSLEKLKALIDNSDLTQVAGFNIQNTSSLEQITQTREKNLRAADLRNANLIGANLREANLREANLLEADLSGANLREADLSGANLRSANLISTDLRDATLIEANLRSADLRNATLRSATLREAILSDATLREATLSGANLRSANLISTDLRYADLSEAILSSANLSRAYLREANLSCAILRDADLRDADLREAVLKGTIMIDCIGLSEANIADYRSRGAIFNDSPGDRSPIHSDPKIPR